MPCFFFLFETETSFFINVMLSYGKCLIENDNVALRKL